MKDLCSIILSAGTAQRLRPISEECPKALLPIQGKPLLEHWLRTISELGISSTIVNTHHLAKQIKTFISRLADSSVTVVYEQTLLGTAGTVAHHRDWIGDRTLLLIHGDNFLTGSLQPFVEFHRRTKSKFSMLLFKTRNPRECGIVSLDASSKVEEFFEKVENPPGDLANAAIYLIEPEVADWIAERKNHIQDFSTQVIEPWKTSIYGFLHVGKIEDLGSPSRWIRTYLETDIPEERQNEEWFRALIQGVEKL